MTEIIQLDSLTDICGHFYCDKSGLGSGYNCNNPECDDVSYAKDNKLVDIHDEIYKYIKRTYKQPMKKLLRKKLYKKFITPQTISDDDLMKLLGTRPVYRCFGFSCPVAHTADLEDLFDHDKDLYEEYKDSEFSAEDSDWMVYDREES